MGERSGDKKYLAYGLYTSALLLFGTNGIFVAHISLRGSQIVLLRTFIGGSASELLSFVLWRI